MLRIMYFVSVVELRPSQFVFEQVLPKSASAKGRAWQGRVLAHQSRLSWRHGWKLQHPRRKAAAELASTFTIYWRWRQTIPSRIPPSSSATTTTTSTATSLWSDTSAAAWPIEFPYVTTPLLLRRIIHLLRRGRFVPISLRRSFHVFERHVQSELKQHVTTRRRSFTSNVQSLSILGDIPQHHYDHPLQHHRRRSTPPRRTNGQVRAIRYVGSVRFSTDPSAGSLSWR